jgi:hypothetical protein
MPRLRLGSVMDNDPVTAMECLLGSVGDGLKIGGLEVWRHAWRSAGIEPLNLPHPSYPSQTHRYIIYDIGDERVAVRFAAAELSKGVWGFYVPTQ